MAKLVGFMFGFHELNEKKKKKEIENTSLYFCVGFSTKIARLSVTNFVHLFSYSTIDILLLVY